MNQDEYKYVYRYICIYIYVYIFKYVYVYISNVNQDESRLSELAIKFTPRRVICGIERLRWVRGV